MKTHSGLCFGFHWMCPQGGGSCLVLHQLARSSSLEDEVIKKTEAPIREHGGPCWRTLQTAAVGWAGVKPRDLTSTHGMTISTYSGHKHKHAEPRAPDWGDETSDEGLVVGAPSRPCWSATAVRMRRKWVLRLRSERWLAGC